MLANDEEGCELGVQHPVGVTTVGEVTTTRATAKLLIYLNTFGRVTHSSGGLKSLEREHHMWHLPGCVGVGAGRDECWC